MRSFVIWLLLVGVSFAELVPTSVSTWRDTEANRDYYTWGVGGPPVLCYQDDQNEWQFIRDEWVQVGESQIWKSVKGNHRVFADSTGAAIYAVGNHYLGTKTTHLIKFDKTDSTWETLRAVDPDSITVYDNKIKFWNILPGIHKICQNTSKVWQTYSEVFEFTQMARDSLATWGPWTNKLLGTATKLSTDSLNLTWADIIGNFTIDETGRGTDGWVALKDGETNVFYIAETHLNCEDSVATNIPIRKWLVEYAGSFWFIELFNPVTANQLPEGTLWHDATFGFTDAVSVARAISDDMVGFMGDYTTTASDGNLDSITAYMRATTSDKKCRLAVYVPDGGWQDLDLVDTIAEFTITANGAAWYSKPAIQGASITSGTQYTLIGWGESDGGEIYLYSKYMASGIGSETDTLIQTLTDEAYEAAWPNPNTTLDNITLDNVVGIYGTYSAGAADPTHKVIIVNAIVNMLNRLPWGIR